MPSYLTTQKIDLKDLLTVSSPAVGAQVVFSGIVRDHHEGKKVLKLFYECYEPMAQKEIQKILDHAKQKWLLLDMKVIHRIGEIPIGEMAVAVITEASHRQEAYEANQWVMDEIKSRVPIWKKEFYADQTQHWIECACHSKSYDAHQTAEINK